MTGRFAIDRGNAKLLGVCAGFARWTGIDVTVTRIILVLATIFALGPVAILAYLLAAWLAD